MWSDNKKIDYTINILLFLMAINLFHYGQLLLPIICLLLLIDNRFKFKVNSIFIFIILVLFAISYCYFSYKLSWYCLISFCLPMAYYVGSNLKYPTWDNVKKVIYIISFGMAMHVILNFGYDIYLFGFVRTMTKHSHYDIWTSGKVQATITSSFLVPLLGCVYYIFACEKNKFYKITGIVLLIVAMFYNLGLGRRMPVLMLPISVFVSILLLHAYREYRISVKSISFFLGIILSVVTLAYLLAKYNLFGFKDIFESLLLVNKFSWAGLKGERLEIYGWASYYIPRNIWGGQVISNIISTQFHDLWFDIYDYAGIISASLMIVHTISVIVIMAKLIKKKTIDTKSKVLLLTLFICILMEMCLEPMMTANSLFVICTIVIESITEKLVKNNG